MIAIAATVVSVDAGTRRAWISVEDRGLVSLPITRAQLKELAPLVGRAVRVTVEAAETEVAS